MRGFLLLPIFWAAASAADPTRETRYDSAVHLIATTHLFSDGSLQRNLGNGFIVGDKYVTAYHNISSETPAMKTTIELAGHPVAPVTIDVEHDLALFLIPAQLCSTWCNDAEMTAMHRTALEVGPVTWFEPTVASTGGHAWRTAKVKNIAFKSTFDSSQIEECAQNVVVEVDVPFRPGSSGGPVFDQQGKIVGLIQGSFELENGTSTGYYKPVDCVLERLGVVSPS